MSLDELVIQLKKKDQIALEMIIRKYTPYVTKIVYTILQGQLPEIDIRGVINHVFFQLWENAERIQIEKYEEIKPYLGAIARNTAINEKKKIVSSIPLNEEELLDFQDSFSQIELQEILSAAMKELNSESQILLLKFYFQRKTIQQIAKEEHRPQSTIKTKLRRSRQKLRSILEKGGFTYEA